jgi:hypothetical protein
MGLLMAMRGAADERSLRCGDLVSHFARRALLRL